MGVGDMVEQTVCEVQDCGRAAKRAGRCWSHSKQKYAGRPTTKITEERTSWERVQDAAFALGEAESEKEYRAAGERLRWAIKALLTEQGWRPPAK